MTLLRAAKISAYGVLSKYPDSLIISHKDYTTAWETLKKSGYIMSYLLNIDDWWHIEAQKYMDFAFDQKRRERNRKALDAQMRHINEHYKIIKRDLL